MQNKYTCYDLENWDNIVPIRLTTIENVKLHTEYRLLKKN